MAGGLFGRPFAFNIKCIIFSLIIISLFFYSPIIKKTYISYGIAFLLFVISYVGMAWYDSIFNCDILPLKKGEKSIQKYLKPEAHIERKQIEHLETAYETSLKYKLIYAAHLFFVVPFLGYISIYRRKIPNYMYIVLGVLTVFTMMYHGIYFMYSFHQKDSQIQNDNTSKP